jgi:DNA-binding PadR family transcriptional regulator
MPTTYHDCSDTQHMGQEQMSRDKHGALLAVLRKMSKKGFYETLRFVCEEKSVHYAEILKYDLENHIVKSRATVTLIVRSLSKMNLIERTVMDSRPIRTIYQPTDKGLKLLRHLQEIEKL